MYCVSSLICLRMRVGSKGSLPAGTAVGVDIPLVLDAICMHEQAAVRQGLGPGVLVAMRHFYGLPALPSMDCRCNSPCLCSRAWARSSYAVAEPFLLSLPLWYEHTPISTSVADNLDLSSHCYGAQRWGSAKCTQ
jgi:hypothetical protein